MSFYLLSFAAILAVVGALALLTRLIVHPHVDELIQDHWSPEECDPPCPAMPLRRTPPSAVARSSIA